MNVAMGRILSEVFPKRSQTQNTSAAASAPGPNKCGVRFYARFNRRWLVTEGSDVCVANETSCPSLRDDSGSVVGGDHDEHDCIASAGYSWCDSLSKCIRSWETACVVAASTTAAPSALPRHMIGGNRDEHDCIASAGYSWCDSLSKCIRPWETACVASVSATAAPSASWHGVGGGIDEDGCRGSTGYSWCDVLSKCVRPSETKCERDSDDDAQVVSVATAAIMIIVCLCAVASIAAAAYAMESPRCQRRCSACNVGGEKEALKGSQSVEIVRAERREPALV